MTKFFQTLVLCCLLSTSLMSQKADHRASIMDSVVVYLQANYDQDYDKIMDMVYPKLFDIVARENMVAMFKGMTAEGIEFELSNGIIDTISNVFVHEDQRFALVDYRMDMMMRFTGIEYEKKETQDMIFAAFQGQYGADKVRREDGAFYIKTDKAMFAIAPVTADDWKFIEKNDEQPELLKMLLPAEVLEAFVE